MNAPFTVVGLVSLPLNQCEAEVELVLIKTSFYFLGKLYLKILVSIRIKNMICIIKQTGLFQNKVSSSLFQGPRW